MQNTNGINSSYDITLSGESSAYFDTLSAGTFQGVPGSYFENITSNIQTQINGISGGLSGTYVTLATSQNISGQKTFNTVLPTSLVTPVNDEDLTTKIFNDTTYGSITGTNLWTGSNKFNVSLPVSTLTPTIGIQFITKTYADGAYAPAGSTVTLGGNNVWTGTNSFNTNLPTSTLTPTTGTQLITKTFADGAYGQLAVANTWTLNNTFSNGILPRTALTNTNIQLSSNSMVNRQATSLNNVGIGLSTLEGDPVSTYYVYNTGSKNIGIGNFALQQMCSGSDNIALGFQAMQLSVLERGIGVSPQRNIAIGTGSQRTCGYSTDNISLGFNSLPNNTFGNGNIVIASNGGGGIANKNGCIIIGSGSCPTASENSIISIGNQAMGAATGATLACLAIGEQALYNCRTSGCLALGYQALFNLTTGFDNQAIGYQAGANCITGTFNQFIGRASDTTVTNVVNSVCVGYNAKTTENNEFVIGGIVSNIYPRLTLPEKHRIGCNQSPTGVTINLSFRTNENVLLTDATTTTINLPTPNTNGVNEGAKYYLNRKVAGVAITINAPSGQTIAVNNPDGTYSASATFVMPIGMSSVTVLCIGSTAGGTNWQILALQSSSIFGVITVNNVFKPNAYQLILSTATALPGLPTLFGTYLWADANPGGSVDTVITLPVITTDLQGCVFNVRRISYDTTAHNFVIKTGSLSGNNIQQRNSTTITSAGVNYTLLTTAVSNLGTIATIMAYSTTWIVLS